MQRYGQPLWHTSPDQRITSISLGRARSSGYDSVQGTREATSVQSVRPTPSTPLKKGSVRLMTLDGDGETRSPASWRVLIADDDASIRALLKDMLEDEGYET